MDINEISDSIIDRINENENFSTKRKFGSIIKSAGYKRISEKFIQDFTTSLTKNNIQTDKEINSTLSKNEYITFSLKTVQSSQKINVSQVKKKAETNMKYTKIVIPNDFFYYLFDFGDISEYERFQASLDSSSPTGIFIIPKQDDFYSTIIERILSYEIIRKRQYSRSKDFFIGDSKQVSLNENNDVLDYLYTEREKWNSCDIHKFSSETMHDVILGTNGISLINSQKFEEKFSQLSLYSNKYHNNQFFVLFNCPNEQLISSKNKQDILDAVFNKVSNNIPYVFKLKCKYKNDKEIPSDIKDKIINHFKILLEIPSIEINNSNSLIDIFLELQKEFLKSENQIIRKIEKEKFVLLNYGAESDEHIYNKYFAINSLSKIYELSKIKTEVTIKDIEKGEKIEKKPDILANSEIIVEVETLRGKAYDKNVYLQLISDILRKSKGWKVSNFKELWLVLSGFEIARNYYQLEKVAEIITHDLKKTFKSECECKIFTPDYYSMDVKEICFGQILKLNNNTVKESSPPKNYNIKESSINSTIEIDFTHVIGLEEEKSDLLDIIKLQEMGNGSLVKGILLHGLPGCGKTLLAKAFANESDRYFFSFSPSDIATGLIGVTQKKISDIFNQVKAKAPAILFIDEIDSIAFSRDTRDTTHTDQKATINQLLMELNNIHENNIDVIVIAATNRFSSLDIALKRSGRFDRKIPILPPNKDDRAKLFEYYINKIKKVKNLEQTKNKDIDFKLLGKKSYRFSPSDIKALTNEIIIKLLLNKIPQSNTSTILKEIERYRNSNQCSISLEMLKEYKIYQKLNGKHNIIINRLIEEIQ